MKTEEMKKIQLEDLSLSDAEALLEQEMDGLTRYLLGVNILLYLSN